MWREMTRRAQAVGRIAPGRYLELRYEDLVREPVRWGTEVAAFVGRKLDRRAHGAFGRAVTASIGISRRNQDADRIRKADAIAGPLLRELGYEVGPDSPPAGPDEKSPPLRRPAVGGQPLVSAAPGAGV
jgi:hypothetical protein